MNFETLFICLAAIYNLEEPVEPCVEGTDPTLTKCLCTRSG